MRRLLPEPVIVVGAATVRTEGYGESGALVAMLVAAEPTYSIAGSVVDRWLGGRRLAQREHGLQERGVR